jgi:hypothetical protein
MVGPRRTSYALLALLLASILAAPAASKARRGGDGAGGAGGAGGDAASTGDGDAVQRAFLEWVKHQPGAEVRREGGLGDPHAGRTGQRPPRRAPPPSPPRRARPPSPQTVHRRPLVSTLPNPHSPLPVPRSTSTSRRAAACAERTRPAPSRGARRSPRSPWPRRCGSRQTIQTSGSLRWRSCARRRGPTARARRGWCAAAGGREGEGAGAAAGRRARRLLFARPGALSPSPATAPRPAHPYAGRAADAQAARPRRAADGARRDAAP